MQIPNNKHLLKNKSSANIAIHFKKHEYFVGYLLMEVYLPLGTTQYHCRVEGLSFRTFIWLYNGIVYSLSKYCCGQELKKSKSSSQWPK